MLNNLKKIFEKRETKAKAKQMTLRKPFISPFNYGNFKENISLV